MLQTCPIEGEIKLTCDVQSHGTLPLKEGIAATWLTCNILDRKDRTARRHPGLHLLPHLDPDLTQVGYGDVSPVTGFGKVLGCFCAIFGVLVIIRSIPVINIITINFLVTIPSIAIIRWSGCPSPSSATASPSSTRGRSVGRRTRHKAASWKGKEWTATYKLLTLTTGSHSIPNEVSDRQC